MIGAPAHETVVLLHGLARGRLSMWPLERALRRRGFDVINLHHPTRRLDLAGLASFVRERLAAMVPDPGRPPTLHGVGHSLGGLVLLAVLLDPPPPWQAQRLVTLGSPYRGAPVAADLALWRAARQFFGPVLADLAPGSAALRAALAERPARLEVGVIAGAGRLRPLAPAVLLDRRRALLRTTDGTVELRSALGATWLFPFTDRLIVDVGHTLLPTSPTVIRATIAFLEHGRFPPRHDPGPRTRPFRAGGGGS